MVQIRPEGRPKRQKSTEVSALQSLSLDMQRNASANPDLLIPPASAPLYSTRQAAASLQDWALDFGLASGSTRKSSQSPLAMRNCSLQAGAQLLHH